MHKLVFRTQQHNNEYSFRDAVGEYAEWVHWKGGCYVQYLHFTPHPGVDYSVSTWEPCAKYLQDVAIMQA